MCHLVTWCRCQGSYFVSRVVSGSKLCSKSCYSKGLCVVPSFRFWKESNMKQIVGNSLKLFSVQRLYCLFDDFSVKAVSLNTLTSSLFVTSNNYYLKTWINIHFKANTSCGLEKEHSGMIRAQENECEGHLKIFCKGGKLIGN